MRRRWARVGRTGFGTTTGEAIQSRGAQFICTARFRSPKSSISLSVLTGHLKIF